MTVSMDKCLQPRNGNSFFDFCKFPCPNIERPICGKYKNGQPQLFKNQCIMSREACSNAVSKYILKIHYFVYSIYYL